MHARVFHWALFMLLVAAPAQAAADFYGVKMRSESYAQDLRIRVDGGVPTKFSATWMTHTERDMAQCDAERPCIGTRQ